MLDIAGMPVLNKIELIGGCARLPLRIDATRLAQEIRALPASVWGTTGGRVGVHREAEAVFLRGYAPAQGDLPVDDRETLASLPYARQVIEQLIPAPPMRCLLARLGPGVIVAPHVDRAPYFSKTIRLHFPVESHDSAYMSCAGLTYVMRAGEVWALNNSTQHGVWNADLTCSRTHMICDFLLSSDLHGLLAASERHLGRTMSEVDARLAVEPASVATGG